MAQKSRAVIFDVDGVLVDSYHAHFQSWLALAKETGASFGEREFTATFGRTSREIIREFWCPRNKSGWTDAEIRMLDDRKEALYRAIVDRDFPAIDGAGELIDALKTDGWRLAVGSSGPPENVALTLKQLSRASAFTAQVTGVDVTRGKPDPQVFQIAAARLDVPPTCCVVIEDAPAGIDAAKAAGMAAVALLSTGRQRSDFDAAGPDLLVASLRELSPPILREMIAR